MHRGEAISLSNALLAERADVNAPGQERVTSLIAASQEGHTKVVEALLAATADVKLLNVRTVPQRSYWLHRITIWI